MIGVFARMFGPADRVSEVTPTPAGFEVKAHGDAGRETAVSADDEPPRAFVEKVESEGGNVYVVPFIEALKAWVQKLKKDGNLK